MTQRTTHNPLNNAKAAGLMLALEPRFMFDAAGVATGADVAAQQTAQDQVDLALPAAPAEAAAQDTQSADTQTGDNGAAGFAGFVDSSAPQLAEALASLQSGADARRELVFVDTRVADYQSLLGGIAPSAQVVILDGSRDGIQQIAETLANFDQVDAIHLISHGSEGQISLGSALLNRETMDGRYAETLKNIGNGLSSDADILIYGCDFAAGSDGLAAVNRLAELTGADVAASNDDTGSTALGGDWDLEVKTGAIANDLALADTATAGYQHLLDAPVPSVILSGTHDVFVGGNVTFTATFDNTATTGVGYAPYIDLLFPVTGKDGAGAQVDDGISFVSASYLGQSVTAYTVTFDASGNATHPLAKDGSGNFLTITAASYGLQAGDKLVVLELPFGSVTAAQPTIPIVVTAALSGLADVASDASQDLTISARAGFRFGADALDNPTTDPSIQQASVQSFAVRPTIITMTQSFDGPENDTATGPNYVRHLTTVATPASGQTLSDFDVAQTLPDTVVVTAITPAAGGTLTSITLRDGTVITDAGTISATLASGSFLQSYTVRYATLDAAKSTTVAFYVPLNDYNGSPVLSATTGNDRSISIAAATGSGSWTPTDGRDTATPISVTADNGSATTFEAKSIAIQKSVSIQTDTNAAGTTPGDTLQYNLQIDVSDYFAFGKNGDNNGGSWRVDDVMSDGQTWTSGFTPTLSYSDAGGTHTVVLVRGTDYFVGNSAGDNSGAKDAAGKTYLRFDLAQALTRLAGDLHGDAAQVRASQVFISFQATVDDAYVASGNQVQLNEGDSIDNSVDTDASLLDAGYNLTGDNETDASSATSSIAKSSVTTTIIANNGVLGTPTSLKPGDVITVKLSYPVTTGDFEQFSLSSFLPLPVLFTNDSNADGTPGDAWNASGTWNGLAGSLPTVGQWMYGSSHDAGTISGVSADGTANSLTFAFNDYSNTNNDSQTVEVIFSLQVSNQPFADQLFLTLLAQAQQADTVTQSPTATNDLIQIELAEPELTIKTGVVKVSNSGATITGTSGTWEAPGTGGGSLPFSGSITTASAIDGNLSNFDGGDTIRLATAIENSGGSAAFDVTVAIDALPAGLSFVGGNLGAANLKVALGNGTLLTLSTDYSVTGNAITFLDNGGTATLGIGRNGGTAVNDGSNVIVVTYDVTADTLVDAAQNFTTGATLTNYAGTDAGPDFTATDLSDSATEVVAAPSVSIAFQGGTPTDDDSNSSSTGGANVVVGESMLYDITVTLPEGETQNLRLDDLVPTGMKIDTTYNGNTGYELITTSGGVLTANFNGTVSVSGSMTATPSGTLGTDGIDGRLTFQATTTTAADNDTANNSFVIRVLLITDNIAGNQAATTRANSAQLLYNDADGNGSGPATDRTVALSGSAATVTVREPALTIVKTVDTDIVTAGTQNTAIDAGNTVEYTITISNPSGGTNVNAYDLIFGDAFPSQLDSITLQSALKGATDISSLFEVSGNTLQTQGGTAGDASVNLDLAPGESIVLVVRGTANASAPAVTSFDSNAVVRWSSMDSLNNLPASQDANERTGADGVGGALNDYAVQDGASVNVVPMAPSLSHVGGLADTAAPSPTTAAETVAVGEIVRYRGVVRIPEGEISDFNIQASLPSGLSYINDGSTKIAFIANGGGIASSVGGGLTTGGTLSISGDASSAEAGNIPSDLANGPSAVLSAGQIDTSNAQAPIFSFGNLTNSDNDTDAEYAVIEFNVRVDNITANTTADSFNVNFTGRTDTTVLGTSNTVVENVVEPQITDLTKTVTAFDPDIDPGMGRATVTLSFTNSGDGAANDVHLTDSVTNGDRYTITGITIGGTAYTVATLPAGVTATVAADDGSISLDISQLAVGTAVSLVYTVEVPTDAEIPSSDATVTYSGLPESFTTFAGSSIGTDASASGERDGSGGAAAPNNYQDIEGAGLGIISGTLWDDTDNANGTIDGGETRLSGQTVTLVWAGVDGNLATSGDNLTFTTTTDGDGQYHFGALPAGTYRILGPSSGGSINDLTLGDLNPRYDSDGGTLGTVNLTVGENDNRTANIGYVQVNDAPVNSVPGAQTVLEDDTLTPDSIISVADDDAGNGTVTVQLSVLHGTLGLTLSGGVTVSAGALDSASVTLSGTLTGINTSLESLTYTPTAHYVGNDTLTVVSNDRGNSGDFDGDGTPGETLQDARTDTDTVAITVSPVNDAPAGTDKTVNIGEDDTEYTFSSSDFGFTDPNDSPANAFQSVIITTLPPETEGTLLLNGTPVTDGQTISVAQIVNLVFQPALDVNGLGVGAFTFQVVDDGGTANGGEDTDASPNTFAFNVGAVNDNPVNTVPAAQSTPEDTPLVFSSGNGNAVSVADVDNGTLTVTLSVTHGTLTLNGISGLSFTTGDGAGDTTMTFSGTTANINAALNGLSFAPTADYNGAAVLTMVSNDGDGNGSDTDTVNISVSPVADTVDDSLFTRMNTPITFNPISGSNGAEADNFEGGGPQITAINGTSVAVGNSVTVSNGTVSLGADNQLTFTPDAGFFGNVPTFSYTVTSGGVTETAHIDIAVNSPPEAVDDDNTGVQGRPLLGTLITNDSDADNDPLRVTEFSVTGLPGTFTPGQTAVIPGMGSLLVSEDGGYTFTPLPSFIGSVPVVSYTITDGNNSFASAELSLTIAADDAVPPDNLWSAGGFVEPITLPNLPTVDMELRPILPVISAVTDAEDLNGITAIGERGSHPISQAIQRLGNLLPFGDRLSGLWDRYAVNRGVAAHLPVGREIDRIEQLFAYDDLLQHTGDAGRSAWNVGSLRHSVTVIPHEADSAGNGDFLSVHTTRSGALLYVELEHTVEQRPSYDVKRFDVRLADGRPVPSWLSFDPASGVATGIPPAGGEIVKLRVATELEGGRVLSSYVEVETDTARIVELKALDNGGGKFSEQVAKSARQLDAEATRLRNALTR